MSQVNITLSIGPTSGWLTVNFAVARRRDGGGALSSCLTSRASASSVMPRTLLSRFLTQPVNSLAEVIR